MRGLEKVDMKRGQIYKRTSRLLERIGLRADSLKIVCSKLGDGDDCGADRCRGFFLYISYHI